MARVPWTRAGRLSEPAAVAAGDLRKSAPEARQMIAPGVSPGSWRKEISEPRWGDTLVLARGAVTRPYGFASFFP